MSYKLKPYLLMAPLTVTGIAGLIYAISIATTAQLLSVAAFVGLFGSVFLYFYGVALLVAQKKVAATDADKRLEQK